MMKSLRLLFDIFSTLLGRSSTSTSTTTVVNGDGTRRVRKETTVLHPDGRRETTVEEFTEAGGQPRIGGASSGRNHRIPINGRLR